MDSSLPGLERLVARFTGPMNLRFIVQPLIAIILGIRDGVHDAREGIAPFLWNLCTRREGRKRQLNKVLKRLLIPLIVAVVLDAIVQYMLFQRIRVLGAVIMGVTIMGLPYAFARELTNRIVSARSPAPLQTRPSRG